MITIPRSSIASFMDGYYVCYSQCNFWTRTRTLRQYIASGLVTARCAEEPKYIKCWLNQCSPGDFYPFKLAFTVE